jgi:hypothetical protein
MTYLEQAEYLLRGVVFDPAGEEYSTVVKEIAEALQEAFDLGFSAAEQLPPS